MLATRALILRSTPRLPFSEWFSGMKSVSFSTPTTIGARAAHSARSAAAPRAVAGAEPARDLLHLVGLDHVADLEVLEVVEADAALVARLHLARVVLEAAQAGDLARVDDDVVAHQAGRRVAGDLAVGDEAAGDRCRCPGW